MKAMLDSGSNVSYISDEAMARAGLKLRAKDDPYLLTVATGDIMPGISTINSETGNIIIEI